MSADVVHNNGVNLATAVADLIADAIAMQQGITRTICGVCRYHDSITGCDAPVGFACPLAAHRERLAAQDGMPTRGLTADTASSPLSGGAGVPSCDPAYLAALVVEHKAVRDFLQEPASYTRAALAAIHAEVDAQREACLKAG